MEDRQPSAATTRSLSIPTISSVRSTLALVTTEHLPSETPKEINWWPQRTVPGGSVRSKMEWRSAQWDALKSKSSSLVRFRLAFVPLSVRRFCITQSKMGRYSRTGWKSNEEREGNCERTRSTERGKVKSWRRWGSEIHRLRRRRDWGSRPRPAPVGLPSGGEADFSMTVARQPAEMRACAQDNPAMLPPTTTARGFGASILGFTGSGVDQSPQPSDETENKKRQKIERAF